MNLISDHHKILMTDAQFGNYIALNLTIYTSLKIFFDRSYHKYLTRSKQEKENKTNEEKIKHFYGGSDRTTSFLPVLH